MLSAFDKDEGTHKDIHKDTHEDTNENINKEKKSKRQQQNRRKKGLFKKAFEFATKCDADVYLVVRLKKTGQVYSLASDKSWCPSSEILVVF